MLNKITPLFNKYYIYISYLVIFFANFYTLDNLGFIDDYIYLDQGSHISTAPNPFVYFSPWSEYFKSWALTYFFMWIFYSLFSDNFLFYRLINLTLHFINHLIVKKILKRNIPEISQTKLNLISLIFLLHPLSILSTTWAFQFKTVLATMFFLLLINFVLGRELKTKKEIAIAVGLFWMSITSKIIAILSPLVIFYLFLKKTSLKQALLKVIPLLTISLIYGLFNLKGVTTAITDRLYVKNPLAQNTNTAQEYKKEVEVVQNKVKYKRGSNSNSNGRDLMLEINDSIEVYANSLIENQNFFIKYFISLQNLGRLFTYSIGLNNYYPFYESNLKTATNSLTYIYALAGFVFLGFILISRNFYLLIAASLFIPISGFLYVPYMKYSYTSDHWFYAASIFILIFLVQKSHKNRFFLPLLGSVILSNYGYTIYKYNNFPDLLISNHLVYENDYALKNLISYNIQFNDYEGATEPLEKIILNNGGTDFSNINIFKDLLFRTSNVVYINKYYSFFIADSLNNNEAYITYIQNRSFKFFIDAKPIMLTPSLNAVKTQTISEDQYQLTLKALE